MIWVVNGLLCAGTVFLLLFGERIADYFEHRGEQ